MSHWGQFPLQTGFPQQPQFQQPQFQQQQQHPNAQFQQGYTLGTAPLNAQPTGFSPQRPQGFQQPQQTGFQPPSGFLQSQSTGFVGGSFQQQHRPVPPPPPPLPTQIQQPNQSYSFLNAPPPPPSTFLTPPPSINTTGLVPQPTGFAPRAAAPLVPQVTGYVDPRLQLMSNTFMPMNTSTPYSAGGAPLLATQQQNLQQSFQQHNQVQRGTAGQQMSWTLSKAEKKQYDQIFRSWDSQSVGFISGQTALEVFGASGLQKDDLARIWALADKDNRGMLNIAEFHVAMGLIYRRLNGMPIPDPLPPELVPPSARDLDSSVDMLKDLLKHESRSRSPSALDVPVSRLKSRSFNSTSPLETGRDATIYKHDDSEPPGGFYQPRSRHINRDDVRSRNEQGASADLTEMKRKLANTAKILDRAAEVEAAKTAEDEELEREMDDLKYRVQRVTDDLEYLSRGPRSVAKDEEKRRLERELLSLMHERIPELDRRIKARDEKREREKRQWARDRDRANERFGKYGSEDGNYSPRRYDDRDRPYSRGAYDGRDHKYGRDYDRTAPRQDRSRDRERPRSPPSARSPPPTPATSSRNPPAPAPPAPAPPKTSPSPASAKNMTAEERQTFAKAEARRRIEARMAALGITTPSTTSFDTSVEERLQQEKKEAEEKALAAEKQAEERERLRRERLENEKALREPKTPTAPSPTSLVPSASTTYADPSPAPAPPPAPKPRAPAPPPPPRRAPAVKNVSSIPPPPPAPVKLPVVEQPTPAAVPEVNPAEEALRMREEALKKQREARAERIRQLEKEEEEAARREEEEYQARLQALKAKATAQTTQPVSVSPPEPPSAVDVPSIDRPVSAPVVPALGTPSILKTTAPPAEKSTNPFSRFINNKDANVPATTKTSDNSANPWARAVSSPAAPSPPKSPFPAAKPSYNTAPSSNTDDEWDEIKENESDDDSSDDEIAKSRATRANIAQQLFGSMLPRPASGAGGSPAASPTSPAPAIVGAPPPPPPPPSAPLVPVPPPAPSSVVDVPASTAGPGNMSALMLSIQGGAKLRPTKTVDKSGPSVSGRVLDAMAPPSHIDTSVRPSSSITRALPEPTLMVAEESTKLNNRQSVDWFANRAIDAGLSNSWVGVLPPTEAEEHEEKTPIPTIRVEQSDTHKEANSLLSDIDKSIEYGVRTLYPFTADGPDELSFGENLVLVASPSKSGGDWWYGTLVSTRKSGLFPKAFVQVIEAVTAKALYEYSGSSPDELSISAGDVISIIDRSDDEWWKAERDGVVYIVPAAYVEVAEG